MYFVKTRRTQTLTRLGSGCWVETTLHISPTESISFEFVFLVVDGKERLWSIFVDIKEKYKLYFDILFNNLNFWVEMILLYDIRVLMTKQLRVRISQSLIYLIKIKHKVMWVCASFKPKRLSLKRMYLRII